MKTQIKKLVTVAGLLMISLAFTACGKKSDDSGSNVNATSYYMNGNQCYSNLNQPVAYNYCQGNNGGYQMIGGYCYQNGQMVNQSLCSSNGYYMNGSNCMSQNGQIVQPQLCQYGGNNMGNARQCYGQYYDMYNQLGTCYGSNCSGYMLREASTGQQVQCL